MAQGFIERAKVAAKSGYTVAESTLCRGLFEVRRPDGALYLVEDFDGHTSCNCQATVTCKHIGLVQLVANFAAVLDRRAVAAQPVRRSRFSRKHIAAVRALAPTMPVPAPVALNTHGRPVMSDAEWLRNVNMDF